MEICFSLTKVEELESLLITLLLLFFLLNLV